MNEIETGSIEPTKVSKTSEKRLVEVFAPYTYDIFSTQQIAQIIAIAVGRNVPMNEDLDILLLRVAWIVCI